ncbi:MAG: acyl-CoA dehydratase activase-related protein [Bacillota bacterium]|nr:acyl-CoA dehydratase activase-related protein [Bacillota bacterium]
MKITFPNFGNSIFAAKALFDDLQIEYVLPTPGNHKELELGSSLSPEEICLPFKIMLGGFIESIENGADTVLIPGSCGPCRFGEYCELQMNILKSLDHNIDFIVLDYPKSIGMNEFINRIKKIKPGTDIAGKDIADALKNAYKIINLIDIIDKKARHLAGYEINKGECKNILRECRMKALTLHGGFEMLSLLKRYSKKLNGINTDKNKKPLKIAIIGEIYNIMEPFSNLYIEDKLMDYGVSSYKKLCPSWWVKNAALSPFKLNSLDIRLASKKYLPHYIGGHGRECIGEAMLSAKQGFDGAIQVFPMGCMPEIVAKAILPNISKNCDFPIMSLIMDEMTGEAGYDTRIEAFLDLLERRKRKCVI